MTHDDYKFVKSRYASQWQGIVVDKKHRTGETDLYLILVLKDRIGNVPRKRIVKKLDAAWTVEIEKFNISNINNDWLLDLPKL